MRDYIIHSNSVLEGFLDRPGKLSSDATSIWKQLEASPDKGYITSIGLEKIIGIIKILVDDEDDVDELINIIESTFEEIEVDREIIQEALELELSSKDFESAIEIICAKEMEIDAIVTDRKDFFPSLNSDSEFLAGYTLKVMDAEEFISESRQNAEAATHHEKNFPPNLPTVDGSDRNGDRSTIKGYYIPFVQEYGGDDLGHYRDRYDTIKNNWSELKQALNVCYQYALEDDWDFYLIFMTIWNKLNRFCDLYDCWDDRVDFLEKAIELSRKQEAWNDMFESLTRQAWTLIMLQKLEEAGQKLCLAELLLREYPDSIKSSSSLFYFYHCSFIFHTRSDNALDNAKKVLDKLADYVGAKEGESLDDLSLQRRRINLLRDSAKLDYLQAHKVKGEGDIDLFKKLIERSLSKYWTCLRQTKLIGWQRGICYVNNKIADIYLDLAENCQNAQKRQKHLNAAGKSLKGGRGIAIYNRNKRRIAGYLLSVARLSLFEDSYLDAICDGEQAETQYEELQNPAKAKESKGVAEQSRQLLSASR